MPTDLRYSLPAVGIAAACALVVTVRAATSPAPPLRRHATIGERVDIAGEVASHEKDWSHDVATNFPDDTWSQSDDFHGKELKQLGDIGDARGVRIEDELRAVDDDLHKAKTTSPTAPDPRAARAVPCKPRPFYD